MVAQLWGRLTILPRSVRPGLSLAFPWVSTSTRSIRLPTSPIHQFLPGLLLNRARGNGGTSSLIACMHTDAPDPATTVQAEDKGTSSPPDHSVGDHGHLAVGKGDNTPPNDTKTPQNKANAADSTKRHLAGNNPRAKLSSPPSRTPPNSNDLVVQYSSTGRVLTDDAYILTQPYPQNKIPNRAAGRHVKRFNFTKKRTPHNARLWKFYVKVRERQAMCYLKSNAYHFMLTRLVNQSKTLFSTTANYSEHYPLSPAKIERLDPESRANVRTLCYDWLAAYQEAQEQTAVVTPYDWAVIFLGRPPPYLIELTEVDFTRIAHTLALLDDVDDALAVIVDHMIPQAFKPSADTLYALFQALVRQDRIPEALTLVDQQLPAWGVYMSGPLTTAIVKVHIQAGHPELAEETIIASARYHRNLHEAFMTIGDYYNQAKTPLKRITLRDRLAKLGTLVIPPEPVRREIPLEIKKVKRKFIYGGGRAFK